MWSGGGGSSSTKPGNSIGDHVAVGRLVLKKCRYIASLLTVVHMSDHNLALFIANLIMAVETCKTNQPTYNQLDYNKYSEKTKCIKGVCA